VRRNFALETVMHLDAFSVAKEAAVTGSEVKVILQ